MLEDLGVYCDWLEDQGIDAAILRNLLFINSNAYSWAYDYSLKLDQSYYFSSHGYGFGYGPFWRGNGQGWRLCYSYINETHIDFIPGEPLGG